MTDELCPECDTRNTDGTCDCTRCPDCEKTEQCYPCATQGGWIPKRVLDELDRAP